MRGAVGKVVHLSASVHLLFAVVYLAESAKPPSPLAKAKPNLEDDGIEAAADALAAMSMNAPELPDLPEHLEYLVQDTDDGPRVAIVPAELAQAMQERQVQEAPENTNIDVDVILDEPEKVTVASINARKVVDLNRFNFHNSVLQEGHDQPLHWIVRFCHDWYVPCDHLTPVFTEAALGVENALNANDQFQTTVRFADVDCSTNKPLCNEVADYHFPQIIHFHKQARFTDWKGGGSLKRNAESFLEWMDEQARAIESMTEFPTQLEAQVRKEADSKIDPVQWDIRHVIAVFVALAGALAGYFWILVRTITGIGVCATLPSTSSRQRQLTCQDMLPEDWRPAVPKHAASIEL